ncbi:MULTISPECIES: arsenate reductase ArsC [Pseudomonas]|jgi:arsenate reductase (thioredoxin)|uniref:Arsenate reductase n=1 Tax=Pseudomonas extremaustralis TaxID=359110 RepID=A0A5C5QQA5_9PSED|nr:arsenate reductase ArsC [Pseudomonas extremaustralis]EZI29975.1 ArsC family transcriptional regulator [Pseudomonas extremaustralis 14-3 substr. 14-3b]MDF3134708.1 arsenate reductase ArsC [Pseudomonas extremaustralis]TWS07278.1 arsenate reductase ArsC [Pseudomonas extremaustralis]SDF01002.1 arsenate reductase [Pseudomonas extremaustralis]
MKVLFMCTANSCRSILSEAMFNHLAPQGFQAVSSGSFPKGQVLPRSLSTLQAAGISTEGLYSKGNDAFEGSPPDLVITVCDKAAGEACPVYFGPAVKAHWGLEDPSDVNGDEASVQAAFDATLETIATRCRAFFALPFSQLTPVQLKAELERIAGLQAVRHTG